MTRNINPFTFNLYTYNNKFSSVSPYVHYLQSTLIKQSKKKENSLDSVSHIKLDTLIMIQPYKHNPYLQSYLHFISV